MANKEKLQEHCKAHPHDYQAMIALLKKRSDEFEHQAWLAKVERIKRIEKQEAEYYGDAENR